MKDNFEFDEAVMLGDSSVAISEAQALDYQNKLGISAKSEDELKADAQALADTFLN